jgi:integrase
VLNLRPSAVRLDAPAQVQLYGKGRKERICPLWPETAELLAEFLKRSPCADNEVIFRNRYGEPLGVTGVRFPLRVMCTRLRKQHRGLLTNAFRHTRFATRRAFTCSLPESMWRRSATCSVT